MTPLTKAILITVGILAVPVLVGMAVDPQIGRKILVLIWLTSSIWAAVDSRNLKKYKTGLPNPVVLFVGLALLWIVYFPNYLSARFKVAGGETGIKKAYRTEPANVPHLEQSDIA